MCGIVGIAARERFGVGARDLVSMLDTLRHRGPDDSGIAYWVTGQGPCGDGATFIGVGASRLSLVDMARGTQPFTGASGARLVFNGEIYNARTLREELAHEGGVFRSRSDTEVVLALWEKRGLDGLAALDGMFALAIAQDGRLTLARDRYGMKPLCLAYDHEGWLVFASEAKAVLRFERVSTTLDMTTLFDVGVFGFPVGTATYFEEIEQVPPGTAVDVVVGEQGFQIRQHSFATLPPTRLLQRGSSDVCSEGTRHEAGEAIAGALVESVDAHLDADHPIGILLSGGLDSSCLAGAARAAGHREIHTFTFGDDPELDDVCAARRVAQSLGSRHHEVILDFPTFLATMPEAVATMEAPRPPSGAECLAAEARGHVKAALCGEGADEVFAGYWCHADPARFVSGSLARYLSMYRFMAVGRAALAVRSKAALRRLGKRNEVDRDLELWSFFLRDQLSNAHVVPWDNVTMSRSLELRLPYLSRGVLGVVGRFGFDVLRPLGRKTCLRHAARELLPADVQELVVNRKKLGFPSNMGNLMARLSEAARQIVPNDHVRSHPLGPLYESTRLLLTGVEPQLRTPRNAEPRDSAAILLFDLFLVIFGGCRGSSPEGLTPETLYADPQWRKLLPDLLDDVRSQVHVQSSHMDRDDLIKEALSRGNAELEPDDRL